MKEIEEKAKRYDEALARAGKLQKTCDSTAVIGWCEYIFPELKESEDERMMNQLHLWMKEFGGAEEYTEKVYQWIKGLLEKQGEQKPTDKIEPKFHEGEWVTCEELSAAKIISIVDNRYEIELINGYKCFSPIDYIDKELHLWTIQNAKESDILASDNGVVILVKESRNSSWGYRLSYHCAVLYNGTFEHREFHVNSKKFFPATKEQRDLLFQKMKEAGYEWDSEQKQLKKIEQKPATMSLDEAIEHCKEKSCGNNTCALEHKQLEKWLTELKKLKEQKPAWCEEDKAMLDKVIERLHKYTPGGEEYADVYYWLIALKNRVHPQPKQEWSEEDIDMIDWLIRCCEKEHKELCNDKYGHQDIVSDLKRDCRKKWDWLESLKNRVAPQKQWKPSDEQMDTLETAISSLQSTALESLYNELKKL